MNGSAPQTTVRERLNVYESEELLSQYLLFHYGEAEQILPYKFGPSDALNYPARCVTECLEIPALPPDARALDLGCAVGRSTFELARHCPTVIGIDSSRHFIRAAIELKKNGHIGFDCHEEGDLKRRSVAKVPEKIDRHRVHFEAGDAQNLREDLGHFDVVLAANLICRLSDPGKLIQRLPRLMNPGAQLIIASPYSWSEEFTPRTKWLGGRIVDGEKVTTFENLRWLLQHDFEFSRELEMPFLIREHQRKFQWSVAHASMWIRKSAE